MVGCGDRGQVAFVARQASLFDAGKVKNVFDLQSPGGKRQFFLPTRCCCFVRKGRVPAAPPLHRIHSTAYTLSQYTTFSTTALFLGAKKRAGVLGTTSA